MKNMIYNAIMGMKGNSIVSISYISNVRMNKGGRQCDNVLYGENVKKIVITQMQLGNIYENSVNNRSEKESGNRDFVSGALKGKKWIKYPYLLTNMDESKVYVRFYKMRNVTDIVTYMVNGHFATEEEMAIINKYEIVSSGYSAKQAESGLTENQVIIKDIQIDNIIKLTMNEKVYKNEEKIVQVV